MPRARIQSPLLLVLISALSLAGVAGLHAQQAAQAAAPTGPLAPERYKNILVLKDVPADELDVTMQYFIAATGLNCASCHVRDQATGTFAYEQDTQRKTTARNMIRLVQAVNAGDFGARINCATCHQGRNQPAGLQPAVVMTPDQLAAAAAAAAARAGGPGGGGPPAGGPPAGGAQPGGAGRGNAPAGPPVDDVLAKYITALGGQAAVDNQKSRIMSGTLVNRSTESIAFTIEEKGAMYRETVQTPQGAQVFGSDGTNVWGQSGTTIADLPGFRAQLFTRLNDLRRAAEMKTRYQTLQSGRPARLTLTPGGTPVDANLVTGVPAPNVTERFYFDAGTGLLLRRQIITRTPLNGTLTELIDYSNYKAVAGVMLPFTIKRNNWNTLETLTIVDVKPNAQLDDARFAKPKG